MCYEETYLLNNECVDAPECYDTQYPDRDIWECVDCDFKCTSCFGGSNHECNSCRVNFFKDETSCLILCPETKFENTTSLECNDCSEGCATCLSNSDTECLSCVSGFFLYESSCSNSCPDGYYGNTEINKCEVCHSLCSTCSGPTIYDCLTCSDSSHFLHFFMESPTAGNCLLECPKNFFEDSTSQTCLPCDSTCYECTGPLETECSSCARTTFLTMSTNECV
jgi:proprotein convertase subtilisin/kexin type 5